MQHWLVILKLLKKQKQYFRISYVSFSNRSVNILSLLYGIALGWPSSNVVLLLSDESPLPSGKLNIDEASWVVGLLCVGGFIGNLLFGYITDKFGRKEPLLSLALPCTVSKGESETNKDLI